MKNRYLWICIMVFAIALSLRVYGISAIQGVHGDEGMHRLGAFNYAEHGNMGPMNWVHPHLRDLYNYVNIRLLGDNPYGLRLVNAVLGACTVLLVFCLSITLFGEIKSAFLSAVLIALDPLHILFSRSSFEDVPSVFFLLAGILFCFKALKTDLNRFWILSGVFFGVAFGLRLYCAPVILVMLLYSMWCQIRDGAKIESVKPLVYLAGLPFNIFILGYLPWFKRGYDLPEWFQMQNDAFREMRLMNQQGFLETLNMLSGPTRWFTQNVNVGFEIGKRDGWDRYVVIMNNLPVWLFVLPAICYLIYASIKNEKLPWLVICASFLSIYIPLLMVNRPIFIYSSLSVLPFGFIAIGYMMCRLPKVFYNVIVAVFILWSTLLYPLTVGISVPELLYKPILERLNVINKS